MAKRPGPIQQARAILGAQYAPVDFASRKAAKRSRQERAALNNSRTALVSLLQAGVKPAGDLYDNAVQQTTDLAQGAAKLLADANPNAQIQAGLDSIGAPAEQKAQLAAQTQAQFPGQGAVLNIQQGSIPGASLVAQKAAEQGYLAGLPTVASLSGEQSLRGLLARAQDTQDQFAQQRLQIGGQLPGLVQSLGQQAQDNAYRQDQAAAEALYRQQTLGLERQRLDDARVANQPTELDRYKSRTDRINARRQRAQANQTAQGRSYKPPSTKELQEQADLAYYGKQPVLDANGQVKSPGVKAISYQTALFGMLNSGVKLPVAQRYLNQFYAPGERGRPTHSFQQRQAAKRGKKR